VSCPDSVNDAINELDLVNGSGPPIEDYANFGGWHILLMGSLDLNEVTYFKRRLR